MVPEVRLHPPGTLYNFQERLRTEAYALWRLDRHDPIIKTWIIILID